MLSIPLQRAAVGICLGGTIIGMLPVFLVGSLAGEITSELGRGESIIGVLTAAFFLVSAGMSIPAGMAVRKVGWPNGMILASMGLFFSGMAIALLEASLLVLVLALTFSGVANAVSHPAANLGLVRSIAEARRGTAFGVKQAAIPISTLLAGFALPLVAVQFGWRTPFIGVSAIAMFVGLLAWFLRNDLDAGKDSVAMPSRVVLHDRPLILLSVGGGFGAAGANSMGAFLVLYALSAGTGSRFAGMLLVAGSAANILARLYFGWRADRRSRGHLRLVATMMFVGSVGVVILGVASNLGTILVGTVIAFGVGWGWNGLLHHGSMRLYSESAAGVTGILQTGLFVGAVVGPLTFGLVAEHVSFRYAWLFAASLLICGGVLVLLFRRIYRGSLANSPR